MELPAKFKEKMKELLGTEYERFLSCYKQPPVKGLRVNLLKCSPEYFCGVFPYPLEKTPFAEEGFAVAQERLGKHPWHHAGVFYLQEPSAMSAVTAMDPAPGMRILDLCAAPGGKSTQIAARLQGRGLLISNEIVPSRAKVLLSNLERFGVRNAVVTCASPETVCAKWRGFFDCVLVDAPCSGEGMFRKEPAAAAEWKEQTPAFCARRQLAVLSSAKEAVAEDGLLIYSTCTFSPEENEAVIDAFLRQNADFTLEPIETPFGRDAVPEWASAAPSLRLARRIFPQDGGEGHFVARLRRHSPNPYAGGYFKAVCDRKAAGAFRDFYRENFNAPLFGSLHGAKDSLFISPEGMPDLRGVNVLRPGVLAGRWTGTRFEPAHSLYMAFGREEFQHAVDLPVDSTDMMCYLHGEELKIPSAAGGPYAAVLAQGFVTGFGKCIGGVLKNHYPKGLRNF